MSAEKEESVLVYDVGGSHIAAAACRDETLRLGQIASALHTEGQTADEFISLVFSLGREAAGDAQICGAELAMPGPFDFDAGVSWMQHKLPFLYRLDLRKGIAERFGLQPEQVRFVHDSAAFLLGEINAGAAQGAQRAIGITLGTGIGSAFAVDGRLVTDGEGVPPGGEIWNLPYAAGTVEDSISGRAIRGFYERRTNKLAEAADIAANAANDKAASAAFDEFGSHLGTVLRIVGEDFRPDVVVLGGGISRSAALFLPAVLHAFGD